MGQTLSEPVTTKESSEGQDTRVIYGASSMQGWRISMEDAHTTIPEYKNTGASFFAVFDGHGGSGVAKYSGEHLHKKVMDSQLFMSGRFRDSLKAGFLAIDDSLRKDPEYAHESSGCTAVAAMLTKDNMLFVSNAGDSRAIISTNGKAIALSQDHKPGNPKETARIQNAGGHVEFGRVNGNLALSRALGDFEFKQSKDLPPEEQVVTADPDITEHKLTPTDEFCVIACDGIWDCMTNQEVADFVRGQIKEGYPLKIICENLMERCLAGESDVGGVGCDNMTVIIVGLLQGKSVEAWYRWLGKPDDQPVASPQPKETSSSESEAETKDAKEKDASS